MSRGMLYTVASAAVAAGVAAVGTALQDGRGDVGVWAGAAVAFGIQVVGFWLLFVWAFPQRTVLAHGLGVLGRFTAVAMVALIGLPLLGVPAAPTLFSLVAVLFLTTLFEPVILQIANSTRR